MNRREMLGLVAGSSSSLLVPGAVSANSSPDTSEDTSDANGESETVSITVEVVSS